MITFHNGQEAKEFLISKIVAEADRENISLSEVEHKMLYFTESGWTLPDIMKVNEDFDREYDQDEYEHKIAKLVTKAYGRICNGSRDEYDRWWASIRFLQQEDHYLLVMVQSAGLRRRGNQLTLLASGLAIPTLLLVSIFISARYNIPKLSREFVWAVLAVLFVAFMLLRLVLGRAKGR